MNALSLKEKLWGCVAHIPFITIIWLGYLLYSASANGSFYALITAFLAEHTRASTSLPIAPLLLTALSIPISLSVMYLKQSSPFISANAKAAYRFNIWLLKGYGLSLVIAAIGIKFEYKALLLGTGLVITVISCFSFIQALIGIVTVSRGKVYRYWYPGR